MTGIDERTLRAWAQNRVPNDDRARCARELLALLDAVGKEGYVVCMRDDDGSTFLKKVPDSNEAPAMPLPEVVQQIADAAGGKITDAGRLPDGSGFAVMSMPLPKTHWIYQKDATEIEGEGRIYANVPPMPFRMGDRSAFCFAMQPEVPPPAADGSVRFTTGEAVTLDKRQFAKAIRAAGRYAVRCATMNGSEMDFDPDALLQNLVVGFLGYWTKDGLTGDPADAKWCDPQRPFDFEVRERG